MTETNIQVYNLSNKIIDINNTMNGIGQNDLVILSYITYKSITKKESHQFYLSKHIGFMKGNLIMISFSKIKNEDCYRIQISESHTGNILLDLEIPQVDKMISLLEGILNQQDFEWNLGVCKMIFTFKEYPIVVRTEEISPGHFRQYQEWIGR